MRLSLRILCFLLLSIPALIFSENWSLQGRVGYFLPASKLMREVYHNGGVEPEIEGAARVYKELRAWANFNAFIRKGHSEGLHDPTTIQIYQLSTGLKYNLKILSFWDFYLGVGPSVAFVKITNHSPYVQQQVFRTAWGVVGKSGFIFRFCTHGFFDLFADYSYNRASAVHRAGVQSHSLNVGGLRTGLGIGMAF